jgi:sulfite reductase alpha subunit-like flavoprotein
LSVIAGILVIFLFVTVPDWYKRYVQQNEKKKKIDEQGDAKPSSKYVQKSKPAIELNKILKEEENASKGACGCENKNDKKERQDGCCKGDTKNVDICCGSKLQSISNIVLDESIKKVVIAYGTTTGNSMQFAKMLSDNFRSKEASSITTEVVDLQDVEAEERLPTWAKEDNTAFVVIISTHEGGTPPANATWFYKWLDESSKDFRIQHSMLKRAEVFRFWTW